MAAVSKQSSNIVGLRYAEEASLKVLPGTPIWRQLEPNSFDDFGGQVSNLARSPINDGRQFKKGVPVDLDASGGFNMDLTQSNLQDLLQGYFFADFRRKGEEAVTSATVQAGDDTYEMADTTGFLVGALVHATGFSNSQNNGLKTVTTVTAATSIAVAETLTAEAGPPADAQVVVVGHVGAAGDIDVDAAGANPAITSTTLDFTTLGLIPGEWIYIGGDGAGEAFSNAENNGFKRILSVAAQRVEFDKSDLAMTTEASTTETIHLYFGRVLKNELGSLIKRRSYNLERTLGAPDDSLPAQVQSEYLLGAVPSQVTFNITQADKINTDLSFVALDDEKRDGATGVKPGNRPSLNEEDALNTSSDFKRIRLAEYTAGQEAPTPLFAFLTELTITVNNNLTPDKAVSVLGAFEVTAGNFQVSGEMEAYFADVAAVQAVRNNADVTLDFIISKNNAGMVIDLPLVALGNGRLNVQQDQPIKLPLSMDAATAAKLDPSLDYTAMMVFFDYLPTAAEA